VIHQSRVDAIVAGIHGAHRVGWWWMRPRAALRGRTPLEAWQDGDEQAVLALAQADARVVRRRG